MMAREIISDDWQSWDRDRLAYALEAHLRNPDVWHKYLDELPEKIRSTVEESIKDPWSIGPMGLGYHEKTGWFVLFCGQGPIIGWIEKDV